MSVRIMSLLKPLECVNCGAPLERDGLQCEYCGTRYATEGAGEDTVNIYADGTVLAKTIKRIDIDEMSRYPEYASPPIYLNKWKYAARRGI